MDHEEQQTKRSRVVVETPSARREVSRTEREYTPINGGGTSTATIAVVVILAIGVVVLLLLLVMNRQANENANLAAQQAAATQPAQQQPVIVQQPAPQQQPPIIVQQPGAAPVSQPPIIVNPPAGGTTTTAHVPDDSAIQAEVEKRLQRDSALAALNLTVSVVDGKAMLVGTVASDQLKRQAEKAVMAVKGVKSVDNQIIVSAG